MSNHETWKSFINFETKKPYFKKIKDHLIADNASGKIVLPEPKYFFRAFDLCEKNKVKVVIIGQDPYHTLGIPNGLAFSVNRNTKLPPSLVNIFKELEADLGITKSCGDLTAWSKQGVLLMNTSLSVCAGLPASHSNIGWENFTNAVIDEIQKKKNIIFLLWGKHAQKKKDIIHKDNFILEAAHPSPLSANSGFFGCAHFSKTNNLLVSLDLDPIDWQLE
ncbi:MAG: uracil-DNA glycosylase [Gammaproteobacteria bacterium TMED112]|mgnify:FL=1|nr:MAG: uracil-DNA glycosylase [Gammaproteobacteria bacterium TMED112]|tara:strand:+ start:4482 stop:5141 length:660 start_codon:yes stop_codon:yes gene_type:complete